MQKQLNFDTRYTIVVKEETLKGFLLKFRPYKAGANPDVDPDVLCPIADLNKIAIDVVIRRAKGNGQFDEIRHFEGYFMDYLLGLYAQNNKLALNTKETGSGYLCNIDLSPSVIQLKGDDEMVIKINVPKIAWTGTVVSRSSIEFLTMSSNERPSHFIPQVKAFPIGNGEFQFDKNLGNGLLKIVAATDFTAAYDASQKAKLVSGDVRGNGQGGPFEKNFTEPQLLAENMHYFDNNPESDVEDLVIHWSETPVNNVSLRFKLDKAADQDAKVLTLGLVSAR
jgi:hypothetical protein